MINPIPGSRASTPPSAEGLPLALVSNNSAEAVAAYLARQELGRHLQVVVARPSDASLMKPHPFMLHLAVKQLGVPIQGCVLVDDSMTDIEAAKRARSRCMAFANKPRKVSAFSDAKPDAVVAPMLELRPQEIGSAGACVLAPDLTALAHVDDPGAVHAPILTGLGLLDRPFVPHVRSPDHPECEACDRVAAAYVARGESHWALRDGEVLLVDGPELEILRP